MKKGNILLLLLFAFIFSISFVSALEIEKEDSYINVYPNQVLCFEREIKTNNPTYVLFSSDKEEVNIKSIEDLKDNSLKINSLVKNDLEKIVEKEDNYNEMAFVSTAGTHKIEYCYQMPDFKTLRRLKNGKFSYCAFELTGIADTYVSDCENSIWWNFDYDYRQKTIFYSNVSNSNVSKCADIEYNPYMSPDFSDITWTRQNATESEEEQVWYLQSKTDEIEATYCVNIYTDCAGLEVCNETHYFYYGADIDNSGKSCYNCINWTNLTTQDIKKTYEYDDGTKDSFQRMPIGRKYFLNEFDNVEYPNITNAELCVYVNNANSPNNVSIIDFNKDEIANWTIPQTTGYEWSCKEFNVNYINSTTEYFGFFCLDCCEENDLLLGSDSSSSFKNKSYFSLNNSPQDWELNSENYMIRLNATKQTSINISDISAWWHFNENESNVAYDSSGNNVNGNFTNMEVSDWVEGKLGNSSLAFDGVNEYLNLGLKLGLERTDSFSFEAFVKSTYTSVQAIIDRHYEGGTWQGWSFVTAQNIRLDLTADGIHSLVIGSTPTTITDGYWHHVVVTYNGNSLPSGTEFYIDGVKQNKTIYYNTLTSGSIIAPINAQIGARNGINKAFNGYIDEVVVYNRVITYAEVIKRNNNYIGTESMNFNESLIYSNDDGSREAFENLSVIDYFAVKFTNIDLTDIQSAELCIYGDSSAKSDTLRIIDYNKNDVINWVISATYGVYDWQCKEFGTSFINDTTEYFGIRCINCNCENGFWFGLDTTSIQLHSYSSGSLINGVWDLEYQSNYMFRLNVTNRYTFGIPNITYEIFEAQPKPIILECEYSAQPYIDKKIKWLCKIPDNRTYKCNSYSYDTNGTLINANPSPVYIEGIGEVSYFKSFPVGANPQLVNVEFDTAGLPADTPIHLKVVCKGSERLILAKAVTPQYKELTQSVDFFLAIKNNLAYYIGGLFIFLFLIVILFIFINLLKGK